MKYADIDIEKARKCCKDHKRKCETCPLERTEKDSNGKIHHLFCWFLLKNFYDDETLKENIYLNTQLALLMNEELPDNEKWLNYLMESED